MKMIDDDYIDDDMMTIEMLKKEKASVVWSSAAES